MKEEVAEEEEKARGPPAAVVPSTLRAIRRIGA
jgi:hypothetical protein